MLLKFQKFKIFSNNCNKSEILLPLNPVNRNLSINMEYVNICGENTAYVLSKISLVLLKDVIVNMLLFSNNT
jgi:hypothetical protein